MAQLVGGLLWLNLVFIAVGYCVLAAFLRDCSPAEWSSFAGVALVSGAGLVGVALACLVVLGLSASLSVFAVTAAVLAGVGIAAATLRPARPRFAIEPPPVSRASMRWLAAAAGGAIVGVCCLVVVAAFRSSPWLNDTWTFWLPKGVELSRAGLDQRLFVPNGDFVSFTSPDYPLWWSIISGLGVAAVGNIDLRAVNAEIAVLYVAFAGAVARLLWGSVRGVILLPALLLAVAAPELTAQTESGGADLPLAFAFALAVVAAAIWLQRGDPLFLVLTFIFVATALNTKDEALGFVILALVVGGCFAWGHLSRRYLMLAGAVAAAFVTLAPWLVWTRVHGVSSQAIGASAFNPAHLWEARARFGPAVHAVAREMLHVRSWFLALPLLILASVAVAIRDRCLAWLAPPTIIAASFAYLVWIYWAGSTDLAFWLDTSAYRVVDSVVLATAVALPLVAERLVARRRAG